MANVEATSSSRRELMEADNRDGKSDIGSSCRYCWMRLLSGASGRLLKTRVLGGRRRNRSRARHGKNANRSPSKGSCFGGGSSRRIEEYGGLEDDHFSFYTDDIVNKKKEIHARVRCYDMERARKSGGSRQQLPVSVDLMFHR